MTTSTGQAPPRELTPIVDRVARADAVLHAWNSAAPLEDLIAAVLIAGMPGLYDRFTDRYEAACHVDWEYGQLYRDGAVYPYAPSYRTGQWPITHRRKRITEQWEPLPDGEVAVP